MLVGATQKLLDELWPTDFTRYAKHHGLNYESYESYECCRKTIFRNNELGGHNELLKMILAISFGLGKC